MLGLRIDKKVLYVIGFFCIVTSVVIVMPRIVSAQAANAPAVHEKININTATMDELTRLKRIGPMYAERIIAYRDSIAR